MIATTHLKVLVSNGDKDSATPSRGTSAAIQKCSHTLENVNIVILIAVWLLGDLDCAFGTPNRILSLGTPPDTPPV